MMNATADSPDFDWVTARVECSLPKEFERLRQIVKVGCSVRHASLRPSDAFTLEFRDSDNDEFSVVRSSVGTVDASSYRVRFALEETGILVADGWNRPQRCMVLTLTLNDEGQCRFMIDGEGEYLRWQVARRALYGLFFDGPRGAAQ